MKVVLKYTDCLQDGRKVFYVLGNSNAEILKTKQIGPTIYPKVTIRIKDNNELRQLLSELNNMCTYEVRVVKVKSESGIIERIKRIFE